MLLIDKNYRVTRVGWALFVTLVALMVWCLTPR